MKSIYFTIAFAFLLNIVTSECTNGEAEITIYRTTQNWANEEGFTIYEGTDATGTLKYTQPTVAAFNTYTWTTCLARTQHFIHMTDTYGDGWTSGSVVRFSVDGEEFASITWSSGTGTDSKNRHATFTVPPPPIQIAESEMWQYSNEAQTGSTWTTGEITWTAPESYPAVSTITRYFRYSMDALENMNVAMRITVTTKYGFRMYYNGQTIFTVNLPSTIDSTTQATVVETTAVARTYSTIFSLFPAPIGGKMIFAVELHGTTATTSGDESFTCHVNFVNDKAIRDPAAIITTVPTTGAWSSSESPEKLFDDSTSTKWCFAITAATLPISVTYKLPNGNRETMTKYNLASANDVPNRDCKSWNVYASNDDDTWFLLDHREGEIFSSRQETKTYTTNNYAAYNSFKFECTEIMNISAATFQMSEFAPLLSHVPYTEPVFEYPQSSYNWYADVDIVDLAINVSGFVNWQITGAGGATLPAGLTFNTANGKITGTPTETMTSTQFTISAMFPVTEETYTTTLTLVVNTCGLPTNMAVSIVKTNFQNENEKWTLKNASDVEVMAVSHSINTIATCLPVGEYTLVIATTSGTAWDTTSSVVVNAIIADQYVKLINTRLETDTNVNVPVSVNFPLADAAHSSFKYLNDGTVPTDWYTASFADSAWSTLNAASRPSTTQKIKLFRSTFTVASKAGYQGFELSFLSRAGVLIYLNGNEIYRRNLSSGAITASSTASSGSPTASWKSVTGTMNSINAGSNTVAVAIITLGDDAETIDFDMFLRLLTYSHMNPRFWDFTTSSTTPEAAAPLFDMNLNTRMYVSTTPASQKFAITFNNARAELFNEYCFVTSTDADMDPSAWTISGSNDGTTFTPIKSEVNASFENRNGEYCFFMPTNTVAYTTYELEITAAHSATATHYALVSWDLYLTDLASLEVPELAFTPSELVGYASMAFPSSTVSSIYYNTFSIEPALPAGLHLNSYNGAIFGVSALPVPTTTYTISALNHLGETKTATISLTVGTCAGDKVAFTLEFDIVNSGSSLSFQLIDQATQSVVASRESFTNNQVLSIPMCEAATTYHIKLMKTDTSGWGNNKVTVYLADGTPLLSESLAAGSSEKEYPFNPAYSVYPQWTEWSYLVDGSAPAAGWNTVAGAPASWATAMPHQLPVATGVTQYYYKKFEVASLEGFAIIDVSVTVKAGAIIYLNGHEIRRVNMPVAGVESTTAATAEFETATKIITGEWLQNNKVVAGTNILAIELHRKDQNEAVNSFDASAILILDNMYMVLDGQGSTEPAVTGDEGSDKLFDNNSATKVLFSSGCVGHTFTYAFNNDRREPIANYGFVSADDCNVRHPSGWILYGSNDGVNWRNLQEKSNAYFDDYHQIRRYDFYNGKAFNQYKIEVTQCENPALNKAGVYDGTSCGTLRAQLADWYLFAKMLVLEEGTYCPAADGFDGALNGDMAYADCPVNYEGYKVRECVDGQVGEIVSMCYPLPPTGIQYPQEEMVFYQNKLIETVVPKVIAVEHKVTIFPTLPAGLALDATTGAISGTPTTLQDTKKYTVYLQNEAGRIDTEIYIAVVEAPINWTLIIIIAVVAIIVIVAIVVAIVSASKKKGDKKKKPAVKKGTPAPKAVAKPKAAVKV